MSDSMKEAEQALAALSLNGSSDDAAKSHPAGWVERQKFDYEAYAAEAAALDAVGNEARYEWKDDYGEVGPRIPAIEKALFEGESIMTVGDELNKITRIDVFQESPTKISPVSSFEDAGLHPVMLENVKLAHYLKPTPIQAYCMPAIHQSRDIVACAQTGSGKTAAFLIPTLSKLMGKANKLAAKRPMFRTRDEYDPKLHGVRAEPLVLIIAPTRELVIQIHQEALKFCYRSKLLPCVVYGGHREADQRDELRRGCDILISTPGRLCQFMRKPDVLSLARVRYTIIDEADEMLSQGFEDELKTIMNRGDCNTDSDHVFMMFSATFPLAARNLAVEYMAHDYAFVRVGRIGSTHRNITQRVVWTDDDAKKTALYELILCHQPARTIIFVNSKKMVDILDDYLYNLKLPTTSVHSDRTQREREDALRAFRNGKSPILITTGVTSRGIDVRNVMHVINYDLPSLDHGGITEYTHRIGRTARIGNIGIATSFFNDRNSDIAGVLTKFLLENEQDIPDFLNQYRPEGGELNFDEEEEVQQATDDPEVVSGQTGDEFVYVDNSVPPPAPIEEVVPEDGDW
ncbi:MAG: hypothetical protein M1840_005755 [Geoglossum simile]|nr:MAG: hypothetical protein M1840_005755 [Geoglossum simile]